MRRLATALLGLTTAVALGAVVILGVAACEQAEGDYCQIDSDCTGGLACVRATNTCQRPGVGTADGGEIDAAVDARPDAIPAIDAPPLDAALDAPTDAAIDGPP